MHPVRYFLRLKGPLADDRTAQMLHVLLAALAFWLAAGWVANTVRSGDLPTDIVRSSGRATPLDSAAPARHFRRASLAYLAGTDLGDAHLLFLWRAQPGSAALRVLASLGGGSSDTKPP